MSKWCEKCYRNEFTGEWKSCSSDCPVFGRYFEDLAKTVIIAQTTESKPHTKEDF